LDRDIGIDAAAAGMTSVWHYSLIDNVQTR
jgi:hypothetical protein